VPTCKSFGQDFGRKNLGVIWLSRVGISHFDREARTDGVAIQRTVLLLHEEKAEDKDRHENMLMVSLLSALRFPALHGLVSGK
jgi:hypothetical protein